MSEREDPLDRLLREARFEAPPGLAARLARGAVEGGAERRIYWLDLARAARGVLAGAAAAAILAVSLAGSVIVGARSGRQAAETRAALGDRAALDDVARLAISPAAFERQIGGDLVAVAPRGARAPGEAGWPGRGGH